MDLGDDSMVYFYSLLHSKPPILLLLVRTKCQWNWKTYTFNCDFAKLYSIRCGYSYWKSWKVV